MTGRALGHRVTAECDDDGENRCDSSMNEVRGHRTAPHEAVEKPLPRDREDSPYSMSAIVSRELKSIRRLDQRGKHLHDIFGSSP
jgi:hypothetical protein